MDFHAAGILLVIPIAQAQNTAPDCFQRTVEDYVYVACTERAAYSVRSLTGWNGSSYTAALLEADQARDGPYEWRQRDQGYTRRFGKHIAGRTLQNGFAVVLDEQFASRTIGAAVR